jgi:hypothetical protein
MTDRSLQGAEYLEIYRIYVQTAENNIDRRMQMHRFFFSLIAAIGIAYAFILDRAPKNDLGDLQTVGAILLPLASFIFSVGWFAVVLGFRRLSRTKYKIISRLEEGLGVEVHRPEWEEFKQAHRGGTITQWELMVPATVGIVSLVISVASIGALAWLLRVIGPVATAWMPSN